MRVRGRGEVEKSANKCACTFPPHLGHRRLGRRLDVGRVLAPGQGGAGDILVAADSHGWVGGGWGWGRGKTREREERQKKTECRRKADVPLPHTL